MPFTYPETVPLTALKKPMVIFIPGTDGDFVMIKLTLSAKFHAYEARTFSVIMLSLNGRFCVR